MKATTLASIVIIAALLASPVAADWMRVVGTADTKTLDKAEAQLEARAWIMEWAESAGNSMGVAGIARYGLADNWDIRLQTGLFTIEPDFGDSETGLNDTLLASRYALMDEKADTVDLAVTGSVKLPTADEDKGMGSGKMDLSAIVSAAKTFDPVIGVASLDYTIVGDPDRRNLDNEIRWGLEGILPVSETMSLNGFLSGAQSRWDTQILMLGGGGRMTLSENVQMLGRILIGLTDDSTDWEITGGITLRP